MSETFDHANAMAFIHERSGYDRGFISNPFAGDDAARLGLVRTERVLSKLGRPDRAYPILHIAGSKGKGSTSTLLASILTAAGLRCGRFLSPHLHRFNERFAVDNQVISDESLAACVANVRQAALAVEAEDLAIGELTAWELSTAIALHWFREQGCDAVVLEVGMGGTLDATNVVQPAASLITRLDLEHTAILGDTIEEIAANKAGIIKPGAPAFTVQQAPGALAVIRERAAAVGTSLAVAGEDWLATGDNDDFTWSGWGTEFRHLSTTLTGRHQVENAGLAIAAITSLQISTPDQWSIPEAAIRVGLEAAFLPGRFEVTTLNHGTVVVIDGAHTPASSQVLADAIHSHYAGYGVTVVVAMLADKNPQLFLAPLLPIVDSWIVSHTSSPRALGSEHLVSALAKLGANAVVAESIESGVRLATEGSNPDDRPRLILVTGSLSTVAEARTALSLDA